MTFLPGSASAQRSTPAKNLGATIVKPRLKTILPKISSQQNLSLYQNHQVPTRESFRGDNDPDDAIGGPIQGLPCPLSVHSNGGLSVAHDGLR